MGLKEVQRSLLGGETPHDTGHRTRDTGPLTRFANIIVRVSRPVVVLVPAVRRSVRRNLKVSDLVPSIHNNALNVPGTHALKINVLFTVRSC